MLTRTIRDRTIWGLAPSVASGLGRVPVPVPAGCSKRPSLSPAQPRRAARLPSTGSGLELAERSSPKSETRLVPSKAAAVFHTISKGWPGRSSIARVERAPSERARSASRRTTRLPFRSFFNILLQPIVQQQERRPVRRVFIDAIGQELQLCLTQSLCLGLRGIP